MANDNRLFLRDFGVLGDTLLGLFCVLFGCFRLLVLCFTERTGVFVDFLLDLLRERTISKHNKESKTVIKFLS